MGPNSRGGYYNKLDAAKGKSRGGTSKGKSKGKGERPPKRSKGKGKGPETEAEKKEKTRQFKPEPCPIDGIDGVVALTTADSNILQSVVTSLVTRSDQKLQHENAIYDELKLLGFKDDVIEKGLTSFKQESQLEAKRTFQNVLLHFLAILPEKELPARFNRSTEVAKLMKRQEDKNVSAMNGLLTACGDVMGLATRRLERFGYSRMKCICALHSVKGDYLKAAQVLVGDIIPLNCFDGMEDDRNLEQKNSEIDEEVECLKAVFGDENVDLYRRREDSAYEITLKVPDSKWKLICEISENSIYPFIAPFVFPSHPSFPAPTDTAKFDIHTQQVYLSLLKALGDVCRDSLSEPMLMVLVGFMQDHAHEYLEQLNESSNLNFGMNVDNEESFDYDDEDDDEDEESDSTSELHAKNLLKKCKNEYAREILSAAISGEGLDKSGNMSCDLAGYSSTKIEQLVEECFKNPILGDYKKSFRIMFVVGGGKKIRGQYDDSLGRWLTSALNNVGYEQDSSASSSEKGVGFYKLQHNTSTNEKIVYVFPKYDDSFFGASSNSTSDLLNDSHRLLQLPQRKFTQLLEAYGNSSKTSDKEKIQKVTGLVSQFESFVVDFDDIYKKMLDGKKVDAKESRFFDNECGETKTTINLKLEVLQKLLVSLQGETQTIGGGVGEGRERCQCEWAEEE